MRLMLLAIVMLACSLPVTSAADNSKQIEAVLRNHSLNVSKTIEKSRKEAITHLMKLVSKAYTEKDRFAETNAWKAILTLDRSNTKALQYFKDLGTLKQVLEELPAEDAGNSDVMAKIAGKWELYWNGGPLPASSTDIQEISVEGVWKGPNLPAVQGEIETAPPSLLVRMPGRDVLHRYIPAGDALLVEAWQPASKYPHSGPQGFARAARVK